MKNWRAGLAAAVFATLCSSPARGQQAPTAQAPAEVPVPGGDTVVLKNGSRITGTLVQIEADRVTVQLTTGQLALIPTPQIDHIERKTMPAGSSAPAAPVATNTNVFVHVDSPVR